MKQISSEIEINASQERVWQVLTDFPALSEWNPFVRSVEGDLEAGQRLKVYLNRHFPYQAGSVQRTHNP